MSHSGRAEPTDPADATASGAHTGPPRPTGPAEPGDRVDRPERLPWLLRPPRSAVAATNASREDDRQAALAARRVALLVIPVVGVVWVLVAVLADEAALRMTTVAALVVCVTVGIRTTITTQRFRRRWLAPEDLVSPPVWVTLATVAAAIGTAVAGSNAVADLRADRPATTAIVLTVLALAVLGGGVYVHLAGGRSVAAALRE